MVRFSYKIREHRYEFNKLYSNTKILSVLMYQALKVKICCSVLNYTALQILLMLILVNSVIRRRFIQ